MTITGCYSTVPPKHGNLRAPKKSHLAYPSHIRTEIRVFISGSFLELYRDGESAGTRIVTSSDIVRYGYFVSSRSFTATLCRRALDTEGVHAGGGAQLHTLTPLPSRPLSSVVCFSGVPPAELVESSRNRKRASIRCRRHSDDARSGCSFQSFCTSDGRRRFLADKNR